MTKFIYCDESNSIKIISSTEFEIIGTKNKPKEVKDLTVSLNKKVKKEKKEKIKLGYICNWNQQCGISTYSKFVLNDLKNLVNEYKIFSEYPHNNINEVDDNVSYCWKRGESLRELIDRIKEYDPDVILIQHEWGIFPKAGTFMSFITELKNMNIPTAVVFHSVYDHIDKTIPLTVIDNIIVHSKEAKSLLESLNFKGNIHIIPHGCPEINTKPEVWNIFQNPYLLFGYGFGFKYKGVERAIDAIKYLKDTDPKFKDILYLYVCSESDTNKGIHDNYYKILSDKVKENNLEDNVILIRGFLEDDMLDVYLRTVKMVIFPYISDPNNNVFGSSGAIKIAMSYNLPVVASKSHLFDDIEGHVIRISDYKELAHEIDKLFSDGNYRNDTINMAHNYISNNTWKITAERYLNVLNNIIES